MHLCKIYGIMCISDSISFPLNTMFLRALPVAVYRCFVASNIAQNSTVYIPNSFLFILMVINT